MPLGDIQGLPSNGPGVIAFFVDKLAGLIESKQVERIIPTSAG